MAPSLHDQMAATRLDATTTFCELCDIVAETASFA